MPPTDRLVSALSILCALPFLTGELRAQATSSALEVTVRAADGDRRLGGAQVRIEGLSMGGITNPDGFLRISGLPVGSRTVTVSYLGYATLEETLFFEAGKPTRIVARLGVQPIALAPVRVRGFSVLAERGFFDRQVAGIGTFFTRREIRNMRPRHMSDVLRRVPGIRVGPDVFGELPTAQIRSAGSRNCPIQFFVDGTLTAGFNIDELPPNTIEGIEIYKGASTVPPGFNRGTAACGTILIWTRIQ